MSGTQLLHRSVAILLISLLTTPVWAATPAVPQLPNPGTVRMSKHDQEKLGLQAAGEVYKTMPVLPDSNPMTQYVQRLGKRLVAQIPQQYSWPYEFHVIAQKEINAFALPGGPMFVNVGTIAAAQNEAQLAGVMAHEMSHVYEQHSAKAATSTKRTIAEILGAAGGILGGSAVGDLARAGIQFGAGTLLMRYSREDESQADAVGAIIMYKAGYNPMELANFFEILNKQGGSPPQFLSDHPNPGNRSTAIEKEIRNWPHKTYQASSNEFQSANGIALKTRSYTAQEIAEGAKTGRWAKENMQSGAVPESMKQSVSAAANPAAAGSPETIGNVTLEQVKPSGDFTQASGNGFSISYPSNWATASGQNSLTIAPKAGVGQNAIAYGVVISGARDSNANSLDQAAQDLIQNLQQSNPGMKQNGSIRSTSVNGTQGREVDLSSASPIQQNGAPLPERDRVVLVPVSNGNFLYLILISPERDFGALEPTFEKMLGSLRIQ
ncbi:MAG TPA: M48 family metalloprotease [Terriglobales bacterium]|nr:M48 family metalloprotease [Terriglobales bacterium]